MGNSDILLEAIKYSFCIPTCSKRLFTYFYTYEMVSLSYLEPAVENNNDMTFLYTYQYKDHLGNIRLSYSDIDNNHAISKKTEIMEESNYYPFGLQHKEYNNAINGREHKFGFGNKEEQSELGLEWIDITARNYDPALGRWMNLDPLAEQMRRHSPYNYAFDNPIYFMDPDGMAPVGCPDGPCPEKNTPMAERRAIENVAFEYVSNTMEAAGNMLTDAWNTFDAYFSGNSGSGYDFYSQNGESAGHQRQGGRDVELINGDVIINAAGMMQVGSKGNIKGARDGFIGPRRENLATSAMDGIDDASRVIDQLEAGESAIDFFSGGQAESESTIMATVFEVDVELNLECLSCGTPIMIDRDTLINDNPQAKAQLDSLNKFRMAQASGELERMRDSIRAVRN